MQIHFWVRCSKDPRGLPGWSVSSNCSRSGSGHPARTRSGRWLPPSASVMGVQTRRGAVHRISVEMYGSLAWTGRGHATDKAICLGLLGAEPASIDPDAGRRTREASPRGEADRSGRSSGDGIRSRSGHRVQHDRRSTPPFERHALPGFRSAGALIVERVYYSIGGGFVIGEGETPRPARRRQYLIRSAPRPSS